jgi:hypothetical protein
MFVVLALVLPSAVDALINVDNTIHTGVFSVISGQQVVRVHVNHVLGRQARCVVTVSFFHAVDGSLVGGPTPLAAAGGRAVFTEYMETTLPGSVPLRAAVELTPTPGARNGNCIVSAEVVDISSGLTQYMIGNTARFTIVQF